MKEKKLVNFETFKRTRNLSKAEQTQRIYNWTVNIVSDYLREGKIDDAYDIIAAGLLVKQNETTDYEREKYNRVLTDVGNLGFKEEEKELRWRLQKYLTIRKD